VVCIEAPAFPGDRVLSLEVKEGQKVSPGQVLAYLESYHVRLAENANAKATVVKAREAIAQLEADLAHERATFTRIASLQGREIVSQQAFDDEKYLVTSKELALNKARAELRVAETSQLTAEENLKLSVIRAPAAGQILKICTYPGEQIGTKAILQMGDTGRMNVLAEIHETDLGAIRVGQRAAITSPALTGSLGGTVDEVGWLVNRNSVLDVDPRADVDTRVVEVRVRLDDVNVVAKLCNLKVHVRIEVGPAPPGPPR
jgi:HlyD family secretion protein